MAQSWLIHTHALHIHLHIHAQPSDFHLKLSVLMFRSTLFCSVLICSDKLVGTSPRLRDSLSRALALARMFPETQFSPQRGGKPQETSPSLFSLSSPTLIRMRQLMV